MAGGVPAGRLSIEIVAEIARLQQDLDKAKRAVNAASKDIATSAKAANDNLAAIGKGAGAGMQQFSEEVKRATDYIHQLARGSSDVATRINAMTGVSGGIRRSADDIAAYGVELDRLRAKYNPVFAAVQKYRQSLEEIRQANAVGAISEEEMAAAISRARQGSLASIAVIKGRKAAIDATTVSVQAAAKAEVDLVARINAATGVTGGQRRSADDMAAFGAQLDSLRAKYNPLYAAIQKYRQSLEDIRRAHAVGAISADEMAAAISRERQASLASIAAIKGHSGAISGLGNTAKVGRHHMINLGYQVNDLGVQFAMAAQSGEPLKMVIMALIQQGSQIVPILSQINHEAKQSGSSLGALATGGLAKIAPYAIGAGIALGGAAVYMKAFTDEVNENTKRTVTMGDVLLGTFDAIVDYLGNKFSPAFKAAAGVAGIAWEWIATAAKKSVNIIIGATSVIPKVIAAILDKIPAAFGDAFYSAANLAIKGVNWLIEKAASGVNSLVGTFNAVFGTDIKAVVVGSIAEIGNPYKGGMAALGSVGAKAFSGAFERDYVGEFAKFVSPFADKRAAERLKKDGKDAGGKAGKDAGKEFVDEFLKGMDRINADVGSAFKKIEADTPKIIDEIMNGASADLVALTQLLNQARTNIRAENDRIAEENHNRTLDTAHQVADIVGGKLGDAVHAMIDAINTAMPNLAADLGSRFGQAFTEFSKGAALGGAVGVASGGSAGGSAIGGGLGGAAFKEFASKGLKKLLGNFGGPLASIAGGLLGGLIGGMLSSTPRASATVKIIGGQAMDVAVKGNSASLKKIAGEMADGLLSGLNDIAEQLGADLVGDAAVSVGIRKKNYRVDTTGSGITKTSKGAIDFGEDKAAAVAYALLDAIKDGVLGGLSASLEKLITSSDDLESNLKKALSFKGVFDTLAERDDPAKWAQDQVTKWHDGMAKIFAEAGATADELAALERLTGIKRADAAKEAADKIAQAQREALEQENALASMRVTLLELQGKSAEALALSRQIELSTMTEAERVIQRQIHAEQDLAKVRDEAAAATEAAAAKWQSNYQIALGLTGRLLELDGDVEALRARELQQIPEHLRYLQELIWAREKDAQATEVAAKAAEELAAKHKAIADERYGLETQWLQAIGNEAELRKRALALLDPSNRAMQQQIWAYEDAQKAAQAEIEARNQQIASIRSTIDALSGAQAKWMEFAANIREFRAGLFATDKGSGLSVQQARADFDRTARMAAFGDEKALQSFTGVSQTFLDAARSSARSQLDYQRAIGLVAGAADAAAKGADGVGAQAANEYAALQAQITQLEALNEQTTATVAALAGVGDVQENEVVPTLENVVDQLKANGKDAMAIAKDRQAAEVSTVSRLEAVETLLARLLQHLQEETTAVTTSNTPATPIYVDQVP